MQEDLTNFIAQGIRDLYVKTGRAASFSSNMFTIEEEMYVSFSEDLPLDEEEYVLLAAEISFYTKVQTTVNKLTSYTTDALSVTHGDKPYLNLQDTLANRKADLRLIWYKMTRYHHL